MIWLRLAPWAFLPIAALLFWLWLEAREDLAAQVVQCNAEKLQAVVEAERIARDALTDAIQAEREQAEAMILRERAALQAATEAADNAMAEAEAIEDQLRRLLADVAEDDNANPSETCLLVDVEPAALRGLQSQ